jgi:hypothetical protein
VIDDEHDVRMLLRESTVPPTRLSADLLLARGRRSQRRWRRATITAAVLVVVAVAVPAVTVTGWFDRQPDRVADSRFSTKTRVVHRTTTVSGTLRCDPTPLPAPAGRQDDDVVTAADPTGTYVIGGTTLWTRAEPTLITVPGARAPLTAAAVNSAGTVVGHDSNETGLNWRFTNGTVRELARSAEFQRALALHVNGKGDTLGAASGPVDMKDPPSALLVWPADHPDRPRIIRETGSRPLAIRDDGTVISARNRSEIDLGAGSIEIHRPDGTTTSIAVPRELTNHGSMLNATVHGDHLYSSYANGEITYSDGVTILANPFLHPVRWNLRTGLVEIFDSLGGQPVGGPDGWFVAAADTDSDGAALSFVLVAPDLATRLFPLAGATVRAVAGAGTTLAGFAGSTAVSWHCAR